MTYMNFKTHPKLEELVGVVVFFAFAELQVADVALIRAICVPGWDF